MCHRLLAEDCCWEPILDSRNLRTHASMMPQNVGRETQPACSCSFCVSTTATRHHQMRRIWSTILPLTRIREPTCRDSDSASTAARRTLNYRLCFLSIQCSLTQNQGCISLRCSDSLMFTAGCAYGSPELAGLDTHNKKQCSRQLQCEVPCWQCHRYLLVLLVFPGGIEQWGGGLAGRGRGGGEGVRRRGRGQGTFHPTCHTLHYHVALRPKGTSHNNAVWAVSTSHVGSGVHGAGPPQPRSNRSLSHALGLMYLRRR